VMKLHLGCGKRFLVGYKHIDIEPFPHLDYVANISSLSMISDNSIDEIYVSHAFEYFSRVESQKILEEWKRVLKTGGELRIVVPDFRALVSVYEKSEYQIEKILGPLFGYWENPKTNDVIFHKTVWDEDSLRKSLEKAGYISICEFNPVKFLNSIDPNYDDYSLAFYPHMDQSGIQISLAILGVKA
jgi:predicted SAM-dependent methyltransferase